MRMADNFSRKQSQKMLRLMYGQSSSFWGKVSQKQTLALFEGASKRVPAYRDFLSKNGIKPGKIKNWSDFKNNVPFVNKKNYLNLYPLKDLCWEGTLKKPLVFTSTSGSTGAPFYFPRGEKLDWQSSVMHEMFLQNISKNVDGPTLVLITFGMGVWIGGLLTYEALALASRRSGQDISILTPGINKGEIFKALKQLAPNFKQVIIAGYPPFVKDIVDESLSEGIDLKKLPVRFLFAAEVFTEKFRDYLNDKAGVVNLYRDFFHVYGSADIGTMAAELPAGILLKRIALSSPKIWKKLFPSTLQSPTLAQFNPFFINFEEVEGQVLLSGDNIIPLVRYGLGDHGGVFSFDQAIRVTKEEGVDYFNAAKEAKISDCLSRMPFVYVYERCDMSTTLYGINIYPEMIRETLLEGELPKKLTGKFTLLTKFDEQQNQYLEINLELHKGIELEDKIQKDIHLTVAERLKEKSSEFRELISHLGERAHPRLRFWPSGHPDHFAPGTKQKWVKKS